MKNKNIVIGCLVSVMLLSFIFKDPTHTKQPAVADPKPTFSQQSLPISSNLQSDADQDNTSGTTKTTSPSAPADSGQSIHQDIPYYLLGSVNDPAFSSNWANSAVQTGRAWDLASGSSTVSVAVIDTGFALNHEDLAGRWATNSSEQGQTTNGDTCWTGSPADKSTNACDDDDNGYVDDWRGFDFWNDDNSPQAGEVNPNGEATAHATMVSGVIGATANNSKGGAGIDQQVKILPLQVFSDDGEAYTSTIVTAIDYATQQGVKVINLSLGSNQYDAPLRSSINRARAAGVLVVAASGNCALNDQLICNSLAAPGRMTYPALYPEVLAVGATTSAGLRASYSSYGPQLDLVAPGSNIGPLPVFDASQATNLYANASGTSFASPLVAGIASVLIAQQPSASISDIEFLLTESVTRPSAMSGQAFTASYGLGLVNAHRATLLGLAKTQNSLLGTRELSPREPSLGVIWRAASGLIASDESVLVGCRVAASDNCQVTAQNGGTITRFSTSSNIKGGDVQYVFIRGSDLTFGNWEIAVQNNAVAKGIGSLAR